MELLWYKLPGGHEPARDFIAGLPDPVGRRAFLRRLIQIESGLLGDHRPLGGGLWEFRLHVGPGYRLYAGRLSEGSFVLLAAGPKGRQVRDIVRARLFWRTFGMDQ